MDSPIKSHVCDFLGCNMMFKKQSRLETHMRSHTGERPHKCQVDGCTKSYTRVDHLSRHQQLCHPEDGSSTEHLSWPCDESDDCEATFSSNYALKKHVKQHHSKDTYKCHIPGCGAVFKKHRLLTSHRLEQHQQGKAFCCSEKDCNKSFPTRGKLKRHQKTHEGYTCNDVECGLRFEKWSLLVRHRRVDHAVVHKCEECEKTFSTKQWLKLHKVTHASERTVYVCYYDNCNREYLDQRNLNAHIRSYHDGKRFPCDHEGCSQTFVTKQKLQHHLKLHDPNRPLVKKKKKTKPHIEKVVGVSMETETRGESLMTFTSPGREDSIDLSDLDHFTKESGDLENLQGSVIGSVKEVYIHHDEMMESIYNTALERVKSLNSETNLSESDFTKSSESELKCATESLKAVSSSLEQMCATESNGSRSVENQSGHFLLTDITEQDIEVNS